MSKSGYRNYWLVFFIAGGELVPYHHLNMSVFFFFCCYAAVGELNKIALIQHVCLLFLDIIHMCRSI